MKVIDIPIKIGQWLSDALKCKFGKKEIPSNVILDKTLPGLGATYGELDSDRHSIIIEPNVPVILMKTEGKEGKWIAVWEKCTVKKLEKYFKSAYKPKKIICTPEGFKKIKKAAKNAGVNIYKEYFCLLDEAEKFIQDVDFRKRITQPINDFFEFENKAMVSATPLNMRHPKLIEKGFVKLKVKPTYDYKKDLELVVTNGFEKTVKKRIEALADSPCVCIFYNSTTGINKIIHTMKLTDYKVFCSKESADKLIEREFENVYENLDVPLAKYNFFTCRFYSAVDILLQVKPDILLLTNLDEATYTIFDPFTESIQTYGRFRNKFEEGKTFNSLTHITNIKEDLDITSDDDITAMIQEYQISYSDLAKRLKDATKTARKKAILKDMKSNTYVKELLDEKGELNYMSVDNRYNEERVKAYYKSESLLLNAYLQTEHFKIEYSPQLEKIGDDDLFRLRGAKTDIEKRKRIVKQLDKLYNDYKEKPFDIEFYLDILKKEDKDNIMVKAYQRIGKEEIEKTNYLKKEIIKAIKLYDATMYRFSQEVLTDIEAEFQLGIPILQYEIKARLTVIFKKYDIDFKVKLNTIENYYNFTHDTKQKDSYPYTLHRFNPERGKFMDIAL